MNEETKLDKLWQQAKEKSAKKYDGLLYFYGIRDEFAELIVRECIEIVEYKGRKIGTKHPVGFNLMDAAWDIKEHFGVEE
jgi:hypothetical protein